MYKIISSILMITMCSGCDLQEDNHNLKLNQIQVIGSHNSYKQAIQPELLQFALAQDSQMMTLEYEHLPISEQLDLGLRKIEIDIYHDPKGARYANPLGNAMLTEQGIDILPFPGKATLQLPGFKVFHVQDVDFRSHCLLLEECLRSIKIWSGNNPDHIPLVITVNVKTDPLDDPNAIVPLPFTTEVFDQLDQLFKMELGSENLITPKKITGKYASLNQAIRQQGWPLLKECKGKFMIVLDEPMHKIDTYMENGRIKDRTMFVNAPPGHPASAFIIANDPITQEGQISRLVNEGYIVRTRADADTREARNMNYRRFEAAKRSGAHYISTDYYYKTKNFPGFLIQFEGGKYVRCNPMLTDTNCNL